MSLLSNDVIPDGYNSSKSFTTVSGCSTFLKTIAGEMNGIYVDDNSYLNYQGTQRGTTHEM